MDTALELGARAEVYRLLSRAFQAPHDSFLGPDFLDPLKRALGLLSLPTGADEVEAMRRHLLALPSTLDLAVEYTRLFRGPVQAEVYPYESMHVDGEIMGQSTLDVVRRYQEAGIGVSMEFADLPDHISAELEFMGYLCLQELGTLQAGKLDEVLRFRHTQGSFLEDHLGRWVPQFAQLVLRCATTPFYLGLARVTLEFINRETGTRLPQLAGNA